MLKLLKYEFRKHAVMLLTGIVILLALEGVFLFASKVEVKATILFVELIASFAVMATALIGGAVAYSRELNGKTGYMAFMTPKSPYTIFAAKLIYVLIVAILGSGLCALLLSADIAVLFAADGEAASFLEAVKMLFTFLEMDLTEILSLMTSIGLIAYLTILVHAVLFWDAVTLSRTLFGQRGFRWILTILFYIVMSVVLSKLMNAVVRFDPEVLDGALLAACGIDVAVICGSIFLCGRLLKHKIDL